MKKSVVALLLVLSAFTLCAQKKRESIGVVLGSQNGLSYKCLGKTSQHFAFQFDAFWQIGYMPASTRYDYSVTGNMHSYAEQTYVSDFPATRYQAAMLSFSFMYNGLIKSTSSGDWNWFAGGGFSVGFSWDDQLDVLADELHASKDFMPWLKVGEHAIVGVEYLFGKTPLALGVDIRPGLSENVLFKGIGMNRNEIYNISFDWAANFTIRYCFGK